MQRRQSALISFRRNEHRLAGIINTCAPGAPGHLPELRGAEAHLVRAIPLEMLPARQHRTWTAQPSRMIEEATLNNGIRHHVISSIEAVIVVRTAARYSWQTADAGRARSFMHHNTVR
jgi:hypothetical protein